MLNFDGNALKNYLDGGYKSYVVYGQDVVKFKFTLKDLQSALTYWLENKELVAYGLCFHISSWVYDHIHDLEESDDPYNYMNFRTLIQNIFAVSLPDCVDVEFPFTPEGKNGFNVYWGETNTQTARENPLRMEWVRMVLEL